MDAWPSCNSEPVVRTRRESRTQFRSRFHTAGTLKAIMRPGKIAALLLIAVVASAQKKPVTVEAITAERGSGGFGGSPVWSPGGKSFAYRQGSGVFLYDVAAKSARELFSIETLTKAAVKVPAPERFDWENRRVHDEPIQWSPSGKDLLVSAGGDLFMWHLDTAKWDRLTATPVNERDPKLSPDGARVLFRRDHDLFILDLSSKQEKRLTTTGSDTLRNGELDWVYPEELDLGTAYWWSGDSKWIAFLQFDVSREPLYPHADLRTYRAILEPQRYPQAGEPNPDVRLGVLPAAGGSVRWMNLGDTRDQYLIARVRWMPDNRHVAVERLTRVQKKLDLLAADIDTGAAVSVLSESDPYWVNISDDLRFLKNGREFLWSSERDSGFRHLFLCSTDGKEQRQLTHGEWETRGIAGVDEAARRVYFLSAEASPIETQLYSVSFDGGDLRRVSREPGTHSVSMNPSADYFLDSYSSLQSPPRRVLRKANGDEWSIYREADRKTEEQYQIIPAETLKVKAADGKTDLYARLIKPAGFQAGRKYPAVVMVYGGPQAQSVRDSYSALSWEQVLAQKGFVIWQVDNRGSAGRGHAFESVIYHKLGGPELEDQRAGVAQLVAMGFVDPQKIGIYGWSYGGFMTTNAMLNASDLFHAGIAGAPVTNLANYDTIYTERYMGLPQDNPEGYKGTNLPLKAANLKGPFMLVHNINDDNVLFQNTLQLVDALERADRHFELMIYPQKGHGVTGPVRKQMLEAMTAFFERELR
jgi:dipeptidyl-peptidase 4